MDFLKAYWIQISFIVGGIAACSIFPFQLKAAQEDIKDIKDEQKILIAQTTTIGEYIKGQETEKQHEKELQAAAPPGYRWDSLKREYIKK